MIDFNLKQTPTNINWKNDSEPPAPRPRANWWCFNQNWPDDDTTEAEVKKDYNEKKYRFERDVWRIPNSYFVGGNWNSLVLSNQITLINS